MKNFSKIASYIFHPVLIPTMVTGCYYALNADFYQPLERYIATGQVFLMTCLLPMCIYLFLRSLRLLKSGTMLENVKERTAPIFLNIIIINILVFKVWENASNNALKVFFIAYAISYSILFFSALLKRKYSIHVAGLCGVIPLFVHQSATYYINPFYALPILLLLIGFVASTRLYLKAHTNVEIILGMLIGFVPSFILFFL